MADVTLTDVSKALGFEESKDRSTESYYGYIVRIDPDDPTSPYIIERNGKFYYSVLIDGTDKPIECARLVNATLGDRVLISVMQNGHSVVTNRIDGDLNANDAIELAGTASTKADNALTAANNAQSAASAANEYASRAFTAASEAQTSADSALTAANAAQTSASNALTAANNAQTSADAAQSSADSALTAATNAQTSADSALTAASAAQTNAGQALIAATNAQTSADEAKASAENASEYAARALGNLSTVQSVTETLTWITAHGTMTLTSDTTPDPTHVYFVVDPAGDYTVGSTKYSVVTEPVTADMNTYYELSIDESLNNYVGTHLALDSEGLWLLPDNGGNRVLIATGAGNAYPTAGTYIIGKVNGIDTVLAKFTGSGAQIGSQDGGNLLATADGISIRDMLTDMASFGSNGIQIGTTDSNRLQITNTAISMVNNEGLEGLRFGAESDTLSYITKTFKGLPLTNGTAETYEITPEVADFSQGVTITLTVLNPSATAFTRTISASGSYTLTTGSSAFTYEMVISTGSVTITCNGTPPTEYRSARISLKYKAFSTEPALAVGYNNTVAKETLCVGEGNSTEQLYGACIGRNNTINFTDISALAEKECSTAIGYGNTIGGDVSHAEGYSNTITASPTLKGAHIEGFGNSITHTGTSVATNNAYGNHAEGYKTSADGNAAHSQNKGTKASSEAQTALGKYNAEDTNGTYAVIVGNGTADNARSNALTVKWNGDVNSSGDIEDGSGNVLADKADTSVLAPVATSGEYSDLNNPPSIPTKTSDLTNDSGYIDALGILDLFYPVGSYYETSDTTFNPNTAWGGTWKLETAGQVHVSAGTGYSVNHADDISGGGTTVGTRDGGEYQITYTPTGNNTAVTLSGAQSGVQAHAHTASASGGKVGSHAHEPSNTDYQFLAVAASGASVGRHTVGTSGTSNNSYIHTATAVARYNVTESVAPSFTQPTITVNNATAKDATKSHNHTFNGTQVQLDNMQPYIIVNRWHRIA